MSVCRQHSSRVPAGFKKQDSDPALQLWGLFCGWMWAAGTRAVPTALRPGCCRQAEQLLPGFGSVGSGGQPGPGSTAQQAGTAPPGAVSPRSQQRQKRRVTESLAFEDMTSPERTESAAQKQSQNSAVLREGISREQKPKPEQIESCAGEMQDEAEECDEGSPGQAGGRRGCGAGLILSLGGPPVVPRPARLGSVSLPQ